MINLCVEFGFQPNIVGEFEFICLQRTSNLQRIIVLIIIYFNCLDSFKKQIMNRAFYEFLENE